MALIPLNVKLNKVSYQGESVGREWIFDLFVGGQHTTLPLTVRPGKTVTVDKSVYLENVEVVDGNPIFLPVQLAATEDDPAYPDMGQGFDTLGVVLGVENQEFVLQVPVREVGPPHATAPIEPSTPIISLQSATEGINTSLVDFIPMIRFGDLGFQPPYAYSGVSNFGFYLSYTPTETMIMGEATWQIDLSAPGLAGQRFELRSGFNIEGGVPAVGPYTMESAIRVSYEIQINGSTAFQRVLNGEIHPVEYEPFKYTNSVVRETSGLAEIPIAVISLDEYVGSVITLTQKYTGQSTLLNAVQAVPGLITQAQFTIVPLGPDPNTPPPPKPDDEVNEALLTFYFSAAEVKPKVFPKITSVTPGRGPIKGGTDVGIKGTGFVEGCSVRFGGVEAKQITFVDSETLIARTPRQQTAGKVNVRVVNPDGEKDTLEKGFQYDGVPLIFEVISDEGPAIPPEDTETKPQVVKILGLHFQEGIEVFFAKAPAKVIFVDPDGQLLKVEVPRRAKKGAVNLKVKNPDGARATLKDGFTYLGAVQEQRVRIRKVVPLTLFDNTPKQKIIVYGRNIHDAVDNGLLGLRVPSRLELLYDSVEKPVDPDTEEEMVVYNITPVSTPPLEGPERMILLVVASRRPNARQDMVVDTSKTTITLLPKDLPVPIGFTAKLAGGQNNLVMVAGRNLQDTILSLDVTEGVEINHQFSEDGLAAALVNVPMEMSQTPLNLILSKGGSEIGRYPLRFQMMPPGGTTGMAGPMMPSQISEFEPIPDQTVLAPTEEDSVVYAVSTDEAAPTKKLGKGAPQFEGNSNLITGLKFTVFTLNLRFFLLNEVRFLPLFDRGGPDIEAEPLQGTVGKILPVRSLNLIVVIRVVLDVNIRVAVVFSFNPFKDFKSTERFNEFPDQLTASNVYGTVVVAIVVTIELRLTAQFFVALILPDLSLTVLAAFQLNLQITIGSRGAQLNLGVGGYVRANLPAGGQPIRPLALQNTGLQLLAEETFPDKVGLGRLAYYFARKAGEYCLGWDYGDFEIVQAFQSDGEEKVIFKPSGTSVVTCLLVDPSEKLFILRYEPDPLNVEQGAAEIVRAFGRELNKDGELTGKEKEVQPDKVNFLPASAASPFTTERDTCKPGGNTQQVLHWYVRGIRPEEDILLIEVGATGKEALPLFPDQDLNFILSPFVLFGKPPRVRMAAGKVIIRPPLFTPPLNAQRQRLFADYVQRKFGPGESLTQAWDDLECSQKGVFLTITHRLHTSKIEATNQSLLSLVKELYSIRGMGGTECGELPFNRMWMKMDAALLKAFNDQNVKNAQIIFDTNFGTWWKMSEDGFFVFGGPHDPFNASDETINDEPRGQAHFFKLDKFSTELTKLRDQLSDVKGDLTKREEVFKNDEDLKTLLPPKSEIKQMNLDQLNALKLEILLLLEMDQDYSPTHKSCTEKLEYDDDKGRKVTGRILYRDHYGLQIPTDFGWRPTDAPASTGDEGGGELTA